MVNVASGVVAPASTRTSIVATSPSRTGDQKLPNCALSEAMEPDVVGPNVCACSPLPAKRKVTPGAAADNLIATRSAAAPAEATCTFAARLPSASGCHATLDS